MKTKHTQHHNTATILLLFLFILTLFSLTLAVSTENITEAIICGALGIGLTILTISLKKVFKDKGYIDDEI